MCIFKARKSLGATHLGRVPESGQGISDAGVLLEGRGRPWHALQSVSEA